MPEFLGLDTSNYTSSAAVYISEEKRIVQRKKLLPVKPGELGLRQSDAVFHHTKQLPDMVEQLCSEYSIKSPAAVSASVRPRNAEGSYMPCFLCGEGLARAYSALNSVPMYTTSHQVGHILAALYSAEKLSLVNEQFIAFHVSGGTTDCLFCSPDPDEMIKVEEAGRSLDLKAGQAVDRTGVMLGLQFPCGPELEKLALKSIREFKIRPSIKGLDCSLSGVEELFEGKSEAFNTLIRVAGIDNETLKSWYAENDGASDRGNVRLAARISEPIVSLLSSLAAVIILFFGTKLILFILSRVLDGVMHLPVLRTCNKVFGILLGILLALVRVALLCFVVKILTENKLFIGSDIISGIDPEKTLLFKIFYGFDLFGFLKSLL